MEQKVERKLGGSMVLAVVFTIIFALFSTSAVWAVPNIIRGPYLQNGTPNSVTIMWRTSENTSSKVWYGTSLGILGRSVTDSGLKTNHTIWISELSPGTKYYYQVGMTDGTVLAGGDEDHYFVTSPIPALPARFASGFWVIREQPITMPVRSRMLISNWPATRRMRTFG